MIFQEVDASRRRGLEALFDGRGGPKHCRRLFWRPKPSGRLDNATKKGLVPAFEAMGFEDVGMSGKRRHVLRLMVGRGGDK